MWADIIEQLRRITTRVPDPATPPDRFFGNSPEQGGIVVDTLSWIFGHIGNFFYNRLQPALPELITIAICLLALLMIITTDQDKKWLGWMVGILGTGAALLVIF